MLAPVGAPGVAADPVVDAVLISAPAVDLDGVVDLLGVAGVVHVHTTGVVHDALGVEVGGHGAAVEDLGSDVVIALDGAVLGHGDLRVVLDGIAVAGVVVAVHAHVHVSALHVLALVLLASHVGDTVSSNPHVSGVGVATVASARVTAVDQSLNRRDHIALGAYKNGFVKQKSVNE